MTQPQQSTLARKWKLDVNTGTVAAPTWTPVKGIQEFTPQAAVATLQEDNVYEDLGYTGSTKTALGWSGELKIVRRVDPTDDTIYDVGQEKLRAQSLLFGAAGVAHVRWYDREGGAEAYTGFAEVEWSGDGGNAAALETVTAKLTGKGAPTLITNPDFTPIPVPTIAALSPATGPAAGGTLVKITGTYFTGVTGATGVKFGSSNATSYFVQDSSTIYAVAPAKAAATEQVTVTNTTGTSSTSGTGNDYVYT